MKLLFGLVAIFALLSVVSCQDLALDGNDTNAANATEDQNIIEELTDLYDLLKKTVTDMDNSTADDFAAAENFTNSIISQVNDTLSNDTAAVDEAQSEIKDSTQDIIKSVVGTYSTLEKRTTDNLKLLYTQNQAAAFALYNKIAPGLAASINDDINVANDLVNKVAPVITNAVQTESKIITGLVSKNPVAVANITSQITGKAGLLFNSTVDALNSTSVLNQTTVKAALTNIIKSGADNVANLVVNNYTASFATNSSSTVKDLLNAAKNTKINATSFNASSIPTFNTQTIKIPILADLPGSASVVPAAGANAMRVIPFGRIPFNPSQ